MWIVLGLIYALSNALYVAYNEKRKINGYVLGIWRGFGVSFVAMPLLYFVSWHITFDYLVILIIQGILIGIYDSHIFFASARYGSHAASGFLATSVLITILMWWSIDINEYQKILRNQYYFISLIIILCGYSISYWHMMHVHINSKAEQYLYPAVFALALMSIATRFIAIHGGNASDGIIYYLTISCFTSGIYNLIFYLKVRHKNPSLPWINPPDKKDAFWLITFSAILITAKTSAMRICENPGYVVALLLLSPIIADIIKKRRLKLTTPLFITLSLLIVLLKLVSIPM